MAWSGLARNKCSGAGRRSCIMFIAYALRSCARLHWGTHSGLQTTRVSPNSAGMSTGCPEGPKGYASVVGWWFTYMASFVGASSMPSIASSMAKVL